MVRNKEQLRETIDQNGEEYLEDDDDETLRKWRDQLRRKSDTATGKMLECENQIEQKRVEIDEKDNFLQKSTRDKVLLEREVEEHKNNIKLRERRVNDIAQELGVPVTADVDDTQSRIDASVREHEESLRSTKDKHRRELDSQRRKLSDARNRLSQSEEKLENQRLTQGRDKEELQQTTKTLQRNQTRSRDEVERDKAVLKDHEEDQKNLRQKTEQFKSEIREKQRDEASIKARKEDLDEEMSNIVSQTDAISKHTNLKKQHEEKTEQIEDAFEHIKGEARPLAGRRRLDSEEEVAEFVESHVQECESEARDAKSQHMRITSTKTQLSQRLLELQEKERSVKSKIGEHEKKIKKARRTMRDDGETPWSELIVQREKAVKEAELAAERMRSSAPIYEEFLDKAAAMPAPCHGCPVCDRSFDSAERYREFEEKLRNIIETVKSGEIATLDAESNANRKKLDFCKSKLPIWEALVRLKDEELPEIQSSLSAKQRELDECDAEEAGAKRKADSAGLAEGRAKELETKWQRHQRDRGELTKLSREVHNADASLLGVKGRSMETVHSESEQVKRELDEVTSSVRSLYEKQNANDARINQLGIKIVEKQKRINDAQRQADARKQDEKRQQELQAKLPKLEAQLAQLSEEIEEARLVLPTMEAEEKDMIRKQRDVESEEDNKISKMKSSLSDLNRRREAVEQFIREDRQGELNQLCADVEQKQNDKARLKEEIAKLEQDLAAMRKANADQSGMLRNMQDVINFRAKEKDIGEINAKITDINDEKAGVVQDPDWERELQRLNDYVQRGLSMQGEYQGSMNQCEDELRRLNEQLKSYHKADEEYRTTLITVKTLELGSADLDKYHQALDKALVAYHAEKMAEVNDIAKFLWGQTYKGQDIESIEIRADEAGKKSYNYRLLMQKGNAELDMRGRCSAGQKVLAALVIRLALAETFCLNCGILALDEPTTNLDVENIKSLCIALKEIISQRKRQKNFQLVIITHDEDFMSELARCDGICDTYYRVSKNEQTQSSVIEEQDLNTRF